MTRPTSLIRHRWLIKGQVQGVGFRPFVYRLAREQQLRGFVRNDPSGVTIEVQGTAEQLEWFARALESRRPPLAIFDPGMPQPLCPLADAPAFHIADSVPIDRDTRRVAEVTVDTAVCSDCQAEMSNPRDRRHGYALINCTNCGPRFSIIQRVPYDRPNTTMARFGMCPACAREYAQPGDRRFHAQPIACHVCGPKASLVDPRDSRDLGDAFAAAARRIEAGQILAIKGIGGFHLAVRADHTAAVARLRRSKHRDFKPFAVMCRSLEAALLHVQLTPAAQRLLTSPQAPIVLARRRPEAPIAADVSPRNHRLGVMLPYTPMHHLLFAALQPSITTLVMTSGNFRDEPLAIENSEAIHRLGPLCDAILWHDRPIARGVDDSVFMDMRAGDPLPIRRSRGFAPTAMPLPVASPLPGLCVGGELKNTIAVVRGEETILSQHLGDLTHPLAFSSFQRAIRDLCDLFHVEPRWIAHDMHPIYLSTAHAQILARQWQAPLVAVQHHHAHAAAVLAEHNHHGPALAVICDGVGFGLHGEIWGGELLLADLLDFRHLAHLRPMRLPGGDAAAKDTRRCGLALLYQAYGADFDEHPVAVRLIPDPHERRMLSMMIRRNVACVESRAVGRAFDGVAALLGLCDCNEYEARAGLAVEAAATRWPIRWPVPHLFHIHRDGTEVIDLVPLIRVIAAGILDGEPVERLAALFQNQLAMAWSAVVGEQAKRTGVTTVALSGGVFCNQLLTERLTRLLEAQNLTVLRHRLVPPNDGGLALGQAAIAAARVRKAGA